MWNTEQKYFEALEKISNNCPDCKGNLFTLESQKHEFWGMWVDEVYEVPCQTCERRLCNVQQYYIVEFPELKIPF
jgi:uncharacterized protein YbaR (Trm112 family)